MKVNMLGDYHEQQEQVDKEMVTVIPFVLKVPKGQKKLTKKDLRKVGAAGAITGGLLGLAVNLYSIWNNSQK